MQDAAATEEAAAPAADDSEPTAETETATLSPSFDCTAAQSDAEQLICGDADLAMLDLRLDDRFAAAIAVAEGLDAGAEEAASTLPAYQRGWVSGRDECWKSDDLNACNEDSTCSLLTHRPRYSRCLASRSRSLGFGIAYGASTRPDWSKS